MPTSQAYEIYSLKTPFLLLPKTLFLLCFLLLSITGLTQNDVEPKRQRSIPINFGFGLGIDYGGIGGRLSVLPVKQAILFGGLGYNFDGLGYNVGAGFRFSPEKNYVLIF